MAANCHITNCIRPKGHGGKHRIIWKDGKELPVLEPENTISWIDLSSQPEREYMEFQQFFDMIFSKAYSYNPNALKVPKSFLS